MTKRISFRQSGGFAGLIRGCDLDFDELPAAAAAALTTLLERRPSAEPASRSAPHPDAFQFSLRVQDETGEREGPLSSDEQTPAIDPLLRYLQSRSKPCKP